MDEEWDVTRRLDIIHEVVNTDSTYIVKVKEHNIGTAEVLRPLSRNHKHVLILIREEVAERLLLVKDK